ncbi:MAG TPA: hypothetical protein PLY70_15945 [Saprospiraceae bacterium]|nr:hypothetical protein [Saprospiraceae bacterium]HPN72136.1 hypothetical protein [Saprospiraceae bacterium]
MKGTRLSVSILLIAITIYFGEEKYGWWISAVTCFVCGIFLIKKGYTSFILSFVTCFMAWTFIAYFKDYGAEVSIAVLVSEIFGGIGVLPIYLITGLIIGLVGGFSGISGNYFSKIGVDLIEKGFIKI